MKKILLLLLTTSTFLVQSQILRSENFNSLSEGDLTTDIIGQDPGQGGYFTVVTNGSGSSTNESASLYQVASVSNDNALIVAGPDGDSGGSYMFKPGFNAAWVARTAGNDIMELEVDINPGTRGTSQNVFGFELIDLAGVSPNYTLNKMVASFHVYADTGELTATVQSIPTGGTDGLYEYTLAPAPGLLLPENTWTRVGISYNYTTGVIRIKTSGMSTAVAIAGSLPADTKPFVLYLTADSGGTIEAPNTESTSMMFDNLVVRATATDSLVLAVNQNSFVENSLSVYPNPVNDIVSISNSESLNVKSITVTDLNGRVVKNANFENVSNIQVNISDLTAGVYMMNITTDAGNAVKKIVKE